jgi:hypothetical protein
VVSIRPLRVEVDHRYPHRRAMGPTLAPHQLRDGLACRGLADAERAGAGLVGAAGDASRVPWPRRGRGWSFRSEPRRDRRSTPRRRPSCEGRTLRPLVTSAADRRGVSSLGCVPVPGLVGHGRCAQEQLGEFARLARGEVELVAALLVTADATQAVDHAAGADAA